MDPFVLALALALLAIRRVFVDEVMRRPLGKALSRVPVAGTKPLKLNELHPVRSNASQRFNG